MHKETKRKFSFGKLLIILTAAILLVSFFANAIQSGIGFTLSNKNTVNAMETDVCKLGSKITVESTVKEGWDDNGAEIMEAIKVAVKEAGVEDGMLQVEAIKRINHYLCEKTIYSENRYCRTIRGALILHQAVCVGYALAFQYMAQYCGINAVYVHGYTKTTAHGWNGVYFSDGTYLEIDVTMNDTGGDFEEYTLITPEEMERLHFS